MSNYISVRHIRPMVSRGRLKTDDDDGDDINSVTYGCTHILKDQCIYVCEELLVWGNPGNARKNSFSMPIAPNV